MTSLGITITIRWWPIFKITRNHDGDRLVIWLGKARLAGSFQQMKAKNPLGENAVAERGVMRSNPADDHNAVRVPATGVTGRRDGHSIRSVGGRDDG